MRESLIEKTSTEWAKSKGWLSYKFTSPGCMSVPDRIYLKDGQVSKRLGCIKDGATDIHYESDLESLKHN